MEIKLVMKKQLDNEINDNLLQMPIDQFGRYFIVAQAIKELAKQNNQKSFKILDIGGYKGEIHRFFSSDEASVTVMDLNDSSDKNYVKGSALDIPFDDNSFDYVVSFEVFEHIPRSSRQKYIEEAMRVSKGTFILTAPFSGDGNVVSKSEVYVNSFWKVMHKEDHKWLQEHIQYKIPKESELESILGENRLNFVKIGNNDLVLWNMMLSFNYLTTLFRGDGLNSDVQSFYNQNATVLESGSSAYYRYIYVIGKGAEIIKSKNKKQITESEKVDKINQLTNKVFSSIALDVKSALNDKQLEIHKVSKMLEERIKMYDSLAQELESIKKIVFFYKRLLPIGLINKLKRFLG